MIRNSDIWDKLNEISIQLEELKKIQHTVTRLEDLENRLREVMNGTHLMTVIMEARANTSKLNLMTNELKGVVAMSRAALDEGKKFSEMIELPNLLRAFSVEYSDLCRRNDQMEKMIYAFKEHLETEKAYTDVLAKYLEKNKNDDAV